MTVLQDTKLPENINTFKKIKTLLPKALHTDRITAHHEISRLKRKPGSLSHEKLNVKLSDLEKQLKTSAQKKLWREKNRPEPTYSSSLPITDRKDEIIDAISNNQVLIISGETGSGKTTQIPKFCIAAGRGIEGKIGCTQPRRIAAITVAQRIAEELGEQVGKSVGYKIRFKDKTRHDSFIKIMTDGILLAETQNNKYLNEYDTIIVDEAHERSLNIDFILGILKTLLKKRKDLKLIITSATIDTEKFSKAFDNAPVIQVSGRTYPVEVRYLPVQEEKTQTEENNEQTHVEMAVSAVEKLHRKSPFGDILIFMPTEQDIRETLDLLEGRSLQGTSILPLYARLGASEQSKVFSRTSGRKIIVATNVAETSITIPGIKYVIDTGLARISRYTPSSRTTSLPVVAISKSSADQRKGRCGRVENGICIRLYSEKDYEDRPLFTPPEILRANLADVILKMTALKLGDISDFPFIDRPAAKSIKDGFTLLSELGAIIPASDHKKSKGSRHATGKAQPRFSLTEKGRVMAKIPLDPRLSRMLIEAQEQGCIKETAVIASALSIQDPRERPAEKALEADRIHSIFKDPSSDFITLLNLWNTFHDNGSDNKKRTTGDIKRFCKKHYLSFKRMKEWRDIHAQICDVLKESGISNKKQQANGPIPDLKPGEFSPLYASIHKSILSGFISNIAVKKEKNIFKAAKGKEVMIFPGSALFNRAGTWIVAAEMVETSRLFARTAATIDNRWLEDLGKLQCKYTYKDPHWEKNRGEVVASEQVSLYGLIIIPRRSVSYGRIDPDHASEFFIRSALVEGNVKHPFSFMKHNQKLIDDIIQMEDKIRRRDILVSDEDMFEFYRQKLDSIYDIRTLRKLLKDKGNDRFLRMEPKDLIRYFPDKEELSLFPDEINHGNTRFEYTYNFEPGKKNDGITIKVPVGEASLVPSASLDWLVPGLYEEKITALIKGLPKKYRKQLVPVAKSVAIITKEMPKTNTGLLSVLGKFIYNRFGLDIPASAWSDHLLPDHLKMRISITDPKGKELVSGRDKTILKQNISNKVNLNELEAAKKKWERTGLTRWNFPDLPEAINISGSSSEKWTVYPGLEKDASGNPSVNLRLFENREKAISSHKDGVCELFTIHFSKDLKFLKKNLVLPKTMAHHADYFGGAKRFEQKLFQSVISHLFYSNIRSKNGFYAHAESMKTEIFKTGEERLKKACDVLKAYHETRSAFYKLETTNRHNGTLIQFVNTLRQELSSLVPETFITLYDTNKLIHLVRYIKTIGLRAQRGVVNFEKDQTKARQINVFNDKLNEMLKGFSASASEEKRKAVEEFFWLIEEYKVSLFAQELKTPFRVSYKRLYERLSDIERMV